MSPGTKEYFEAIKDETRYKIFFTALELFAKRGCSVKISEIAKHAGISQGLLYHYYRSKDELLAALAQQAAQGADTAVQAIAELPGTAKERIEALTAMMLDVFHQDDITAQFFMFMIQVSTTDPITPGVLEALQDAGKPVEHLARIISEGQGQGTMVAGDPYKLSLLYWSAIQGMCCYKIAGMDALPEPAMLNHILLK